MASAVVVHGIDDNLLTLLDGVQGLFEMALDVIDSGVNMDTPAYVYSEEGKELMALEI